MQPVVVMAFRKRLHNRGYVAISIRKAKEPGLYVVEATEPLARVRVSRAYSLEGMNVSFRF